MLILIDRIKSNIQTTIGELRIPSLSNGILMFTLEDEYRAKKVFGETRIPAGDYDVRLRNEGGMAPRYNGQFKEINHRGMLHLQNVPGFEWIYIHVGNSDDDTNGCILVGYTASLATMRIMDSRNAYRALYNAVADAAEAKALTVTIRDRDGAHG